MYILLTESMEASSGGIVPDKEFAWRSLEVPKVKEFNRFSSKQEEEALTIP